MTSPSRQAGTAGMQIISGGSGASFVPSKPTASAAGKLLLATYYLEATGAVTPPTGFTNKIDLTVGVGRVRVDYKHADGSEGATLTWSWTGSQWRMGCLFCVENAQTTGDPIELQVTSTAAAGNQPPNVALSGNATIDDWILLLAANPSNGSGNWAAPGTGGWVLEQNFAGDDFAVASVAQAVGGAPATAHIQSPTTGVSSVASVILAVKSPAAGAGSLVLPRRRNNIIIPRRRFI